MKQPFNLQAGSALVCRIRSLNRIGWSDWSPVNEGGFPLPDCGEDRALAGPAQAGCGDGSCRRSCQSTGCGGCCGGNQAGADGTFWAKAANKACCSTGACSDGCGAAASLTD